MSTFNVTANENYLKAVPIDETGVKLVATDCGDTVGINLGAGRHFVGVTMTTELDPTTALNLAEWLLDWALPRTANNEAKMTVGEALQRVR